MTISASANTVSFRDLERDEIDRVLSENRVGRLAYALHERVDIQPLHYVYHDRCIYGRTSDGTKIQTVQHNQWVAFEVDEVEGDFNWTSVVIHGFFQILDPETSPHDADVWRRAALLIRTMIPGSFTGHDPAPFRTVLFRIYINEVRGREARSSRPVGSTTESLL